MPAKPTHDILKDLRNQESLVFECLWGNIKDLLSELLDKQMVKQIHCKEYV